ncbi:hypothetical protein [Plebeiibacterium sediminum]|uniref:Uncharacterized protein n=1 Tax=Plebeiibacterium sediminum TaxID=2992112 RepID=A0AAE3SES6_9BACT|nr:hypothetical protein [Plebeiobacterium sediminum]MCW3786317.1 hypothetical protein [Plebeiobacterium sediminum]
MNGDVSHLFAETSIDDEVLYVGRAPELSAGSEYTIRIGYRDTSDESKFIRMYINITLE